MIKWVLLFFVITILVLVIVYNVINQNEKYGLYFPSKKRVWKPKVNYKNVFLNVNNCKDVVYCSRRRKPGQEYIAGWHFDNYPSAKTVIFCHGNTGNVTHRQYIIDMCTKFKLNLFLFDTRGYGRSDSFPDKLFLREDGELAYEYLHHVAKVPHRKIILWGESLGGVTAVWTASKYPCGGLILLSTFSSLDDAINHKYKGKMAVKFLTSLLSYKMDMIPLKNYLRKVTCPTAIIHSDEDELIPYECSLINYDSIQHKNKIHIKIKGGHASPRIKSKQLRKIFRFCDLSMDYLSSDVNISDMLEDLRTVAARHGNFMD